MKTEVIVWALKGLKLVDILIKSSPSVVCVACRVTDDGKVNTLLCEGQCQGQKWLQKWLHCYCADVTLGLYEKLSLSEVCFTCCQAQHFTELRGKVDLLTSGLSQLIAQLQLTRPQILSNKLSTERRRNFLAACQEVTFLEKTLFSAGNHSDY